MTTLKFILFTAWSVLLWLSLVITDSTEDWRVVALFVVGSGLMAALVALTVLGDNE